MNIEESVICCGVNQLYSLAYFKDDLRRTFKDELDMRSGQYFYPDEFHPPGGNCLLTEAFVFSDVVHLRMDSENDEPGGPVPGDEGGQGLAAWIIEKGWGDLEVGREFVNPNTGNTCRIWTWYPNMVFWDWVQGKRKKKVAA